MTFTEYLKQKQYSPVTINRYEIYSHRFLIWLNEEELQPESFIYGDLLDFMRYCNSHGITKRTVHNILCIVRHYCNYLIHEKRRTDNPAAGIFIN